MGWAALRAGFGLGVRLGTKRRIIAVGIVPLPIAICVGFEFATAIIAASTHGKEFHFLDQVHARGDLEL